MGDSRAAIRQQDVVDACVDGRDLLRVLGVPPFER